MLHTVWGITYVTPQLSERDFVALVVLPPFSKVREENTSPKGRSAFFLKIHRPRSYKSTRQYVATKICVKYAEMRWVVSKFHMYAH